MSAIGELGPGFESGQFDPYGAFGAFGAFVAIFEHSTICTGHLSILPGLVFDRKTASQAVFEVGVFPNS